MQRAKAFFRQAAQGTAGRCAAPCAAADGRAGDGVAEADVVIEAIVESVDASAPLRPTRTETQTYRPYLPPTPRASDRNSRGRLRDPTAWSASISSIGGQLQLWKSCRASAPKRRMVQDALRFTRKARQAAAPCKSAPGFVVNRIFEPYVNEALFALESGIPAAVIDRAGKDFRMPMGPIELTDVVAWMSRSMWTGSADACSGGA